MKKLLLSLSILASTNAFAVHNGNVDGNIKGNQPGDNFHAVDPSDYPSIVEDGCTGTMVAGRFVISAGHCVEAGHGGNWVSYGSLELFEKIDEYGLKDGYLTAYSNYSYEGIPFFHTNEQYIDTPLVDKRVFDFPNDNYVGEWRDFSITHTVTQIKVTNDKMIFLTDLTNAKRTPKAGDKIRSFGSHCGHEEPSKCNVNISDTSGFSYATRVVKNITNISNSGFELETKVGKSFMVPGDSGGAVLNASDELIAINTDSASSPDTNDGYALLSGYSDVILETINRWHYPTVAYMKAGKQKTITIQSLHVLDESLTTSTITASDNVNIIDTTCDAGNGIKPYGKCYITFESTDGKVGKIILGDDDQYIDINPKARPAIIDLRKKDATKELPKATTQPAGSSDGGGSSGAGIGIYTSLVLFGFALFRSRKTTVEKEL